MTLEAFIRLIIRLLAAAAIAAGVVVGLVDTSMSQSKETQSMAKTHEFVGMWVTRDGHVRHELLPNNRYDEARGNRKSAYQGRYTITGNRIDYIDDTGFTADGEFIDGVLHHGGMILYRTR